MNQKILQKLINKEQLVFADFEYIFNAIYQNSLPKSLLGAFIQGVTQKGIDACELKDLALALSSFNQDIELGVGNIVGCVGTGADNQNTFNITTCSALTAAACGVNIAKKVKNSLSAKNCTRDFLNQLGITIFDEKSSIKKQFNDNNICFFNTCFSNSVEYNLDSVRKELNFNTIFNITDAIIHPNLVDKLLIGTAYPDMAEPIAQTLKVLGTKHALIVIAQNPLLDEISICSETTIVELKDGEIEKYEITPDNFGIKRADILSLRGATAKYNANLALDIFSGKIKDAKLDVIALNAGALIYLSGEARNYLDGIMKAYTAIDNGLVLEKIQNLKNCV